MDKVTEHAQIGLSVIRDALERRGEFGNDDTIPESTRGLMIHVLALLHMVSLYNGVPIPRLVDSLAFGLTLAERINEDRQS